MSLMLLRSLSNRTIVSLGWYFVAELTEDAISDSDIRIHPGRKHFPMIIGVLLLTAIVGTCTICREVKSRVRQCSVFCKHCTADLTIDLRSPPPTHQSTHHPPTQKILLAPRSEPSTQKHLFPNNKSHTCEPFCARIQWRYVLVLIFQLHDSRKSIGLTVVNIEAS